MRPSLFPVLPPLLREFAVVLGELAAVLIDRVGESHQRRGYPLVEFDVRLEGLKGDLESPIDTVRKAAQSLPFSITVVLGHEPIVARGV